MRLCITRDGGQVTAAEVCAVLRQDPENIEVPSQPVPA